MWGTDYVKKNNHVSDITEMEQVERHDSWITAERPSCVLGLSASSRPQSSGTPQDHSGQLQTSLPGHAPAAPVSGPHRLATVPLVCHMVPI